MRHLLTIPALALLLACGQEAREPVTSDGLEVGDDNGSAARAPGDGNAPEPAGDGSPTADAGAEPGMRWAFAQTAAGPKLTYGEPNTDNLKLMLRCAGEERIRLSFMRPAGASGGEFVLSSGGAQTRVDASADESEIGGVTIAAVAPAATGPLQNFRSGRPLEVRWKGETVTVPAAGDEARQFFDACRASN